MRWYFDFISPFAYLQSTRLTDFATHNQIAFKPVLFAGLLNHWGQLGPAEMKSKRQWTFEHCVWQAHRDGIPLNLPPEHPFNPLPLLRLCIAAGISDSEISTPEKIEIVQRLFRYVWVEQQLPGNEEAFAGLCNEFNLQPADINSAHVKEALLANGESAISEAVFGVPTVITGKKLYWGYDATDMVLASLNQDQSDSNFPADKISKVANLPEGLQRKVKAN